MTEVLYRSVYFIYEGGIIMKILDAFTLTNEQEIMELAAKNEYDVWVQYAPNAPLSAFCTKLQVDDKESAYAYINSGGGVVDVNGSLMEMYKARFYLQEQDSYQRLWIPISHRSDLVVQDIWSTIVDVGGAPVLDFPALQAELQLTYQMWEDDWAEAKDQATDCFCLVQDRPDILGYTVLRKENGHYIWREISGVFQYKHAPQEKINKFRDQQQDIYIFSPSYEVSRRMLFVLGKTYAPEYMTINIDVAKRLRKMSWEAFALYQKAINLFNAVPDPYADIAHGLSRSIIYLEQMVKLEAPDILLTENLNNLEKHIRQVMPYKSHILE